MHAYIVVSLMAGMRPEEARAIGWEEDVDLDGNPPSVAVLRADRAGGDTKTPRSRRALKLAQMAAGALREWQVDQAAEREAAGSRWQDTGRVFTTATGTPLGARHIRKMFQDVCERAGLGRDWAPRDLRHTFVSLLSDDGMAIEKIARLAGHAQEMAFAAVVGPPERERIVAASSYYLSPATGLAEVAYMVDPDWQGVGLAGLLHARMFEYARERGVRGFRADVLLGNTQMMRVFERAGHQLSVKTSGGIEEVTMLFRDYVADQLLAARAGQGTQPG